MEREREREGEREVEAEDIQTRTYHSVPKCSMLCPFAERNVCMTFK